MKIRLYGYNDRDAVLESLLLSNGNIELALDIWNRIQNQPNKRRDCSRIAKKTSNLAQLTPMKNTGVV